MIEDLLPEEVRLRAVILHGGPIAAVENGRDRGNRARMVLERAPKQFQRARRE